MTPAWTPELQVWLDATLSHPNGQVFLAELKERCRVKPDKAMLGPGYDALVLAAAGFNHAQGQSSVFEQIQDMRTEKKTPQELPPAFDAAADEEWMKSRNL